MRVSQYNILQETADNKLIIYNTKTAQVAYISKDSDIEYVRNNVLNNEIDLNNDIDKNLYRLGFIIDDDYNEYEECKKEISEKYKILDRELTLQLFLTEMCNFSCVYCYEKRSKLKMSSKILDGIYKYIEKSLSQNMFDKVSIYFFGGEPLLEKNKIFSFLKKMKKLQEQYLNVVFYYSITTNGYLLTPEVYDSLTSLNLLNYQITLDSSKENHDAQRPLANGQGTWDKIISNIEYINAKQDDAIVNIRTNVDNELIQKIEIFKKWFKSTFSNKKFVLTVQPIIGFTDNVPSSTTFNHEIVNAKDNLLDILTDEGSHRYPIKKFQACSVAAKYFFSVHPNGNLIKCQKDSSASDLLPVGVISEDGELVLNNYYDLFVKDFEYDNCKDCVVYPICCARTCPLMRAHSSINNTERYDCLKMINFYNNYIVPFVSKKLISLYKK